MFSQSIISLALRALALIGKFVLVVYLARHLTPDDLGRFSLIASAIGLCVLAIGLDFYAFNTRQIIAADSDSRYQLIRNQFAMHLVTYLLSIPLLSLFFVSGSLEWRFASWFFAILVLEHLAQEMYRILIVLGEPIWANVSLLLRGGGWVFLFMIAFYYASAEPDLGAVFLAWTCGGLASLAVSLAVLRHLLGPVAGGLRIDWAWMLHGIRQSGVFFAATIILKSIEYGERFILQYYRGESDVGIYSFYASIAIAVQAFVIAGVISILYPKVLRAYNESDMRQYRALLSKLAVQSVSLAVVMGVAAMLVLGPVLEYIGQPVFKEYSHILLILILSSICVIASFVPHYALYARHADRSLLVASASALLVVVVGSIVLVPRYGILATALVNLAGAVTLLAAKSLLLMWPRKAPAA